MSIINACTTRPCTTKQLMARLGLNFHQVEYQLRNLRRDGYIHIVGQDKTSGRNPENLYSVHRVRTASAPHLTVWRGPLPTEWRTNHETDSRISCRKP